MMASIRAEHYVLPRVKSRKLISVVFVVSKRLKVI